MAIPCKIVNITCPTPTLAFNVVSIDKSDVTIDVNVCNPGEGATWNTGYPLFDSEHPDMTRPLNVRVGRYVLTIPDAGTLRIYLKGKNSCGIEAVTYKDVTIVPCAPSWSCDTGTGQENDGCGNVRSTTSCRYAYTAMQMVVGNIPMDLRYDLNGNGTVDTGDVTLLAAGGSLVPLPCVPSWSCNTGTGQENDGCGNVRSTTSCTNAYTAMQMVVGNIPMDLRYDLNGNGTVDTGDVTLLAAGGSLKPYPAKITAVSVTPSPVTCVAPCNVTVTAVWRNDGGVAGTLTPAITVNGVRNALPALSLEPGLSVTRTFPVSGLATGTYTICPDPN